VLTGKQGGRLDVHFNLALLRRVFWFAVFLALDVLLLLAAAGMR
jgi:hypothetical protein